jgi:hypothetical protein
MAQVYLPEIINYADSEIKSALRATLSQHFPDQDYVSDAVFRTLKRMISRKCDYWITVPDNLVIKH